MPKRQTYLTLDLVSHQPDEDVQRISTPLQHAALAHPLRQRLLFALSSRPSTISRLAAQLGANKGSVSHHLRVLCEAGLVQDAGTRQVRGGTEKYYRRTAGRLLVAEPRSEGTAALLGAAMAVAPLSVRRNPTSAMPVRSSPRMTHSSPSVAKRGTPSVFRHSMPRTTAHMTGLIGELRQACDAGGEFARDRFGEERQHGRDRDARQCQAQPQDAWR